MSDNCDEFVEAFDKAVNDWSAFVFSQRKAQLAIPTPEEAKGLLESVGREEVPYVAAFLKASASLNDCKKSKELS
jgi:hypothetical protein